MGARPGADATLVEAVAQRVVELLAQDHRKPGRETARDAASESWLTVGDVAMR